MSVPDPDSANNESITAHFMGGQLEGFSKGDVIVHGDEQPAGVYFIQSGYAKAYSISPLGQHNLLLIHGANEIMPLPWALDGPQKVGVFYQAMSDMKVLRASKQSLRSAMGSEPWLAEQMLRQLVSTFTIYAQRIENLGYRTPRERVIACLLDLAERFGRESTEGVVIQAPITHQDVADSINMNRETASRVLEQLVKTKLISQESHLFVIRNGDLLRAELS
jgi:CRP/FNR family transcriptional regulator